MVLALILHKKTGLKSRVNTVPKNFTFVFNKLHPTHMNTVKL